MCIRVRIPLGLRCGCSETKQKKVKGKSLHKKSQPSILWVPLKGAHTYITDGPKNGGENFILTLNFKTRFEFIR